MDFKTIGSYVHIDPKGKVIERLNKMNLKGEDIVRMLNRSKSCVMAGSIPLQILLDEEYEGSDLDFFVSEDDTEVKLPMSNYRLSSELELYFAMRHKSTSNSCNEKTKGKDYKKTTNKSTYSGGRAQNKGESKGMHRGKSSKSSKPLKPSKPSQNKAYYSPKTTTLHSSEHFDNISHYTRIDARVRQVRGYVAGDSDIDVQFIKVGVPSDKSKMIDYISKAFDLSFCKVVFDGKDIIVHKDIFMDVLKKKGSWQKRSHDMVVNETLRVKKYMSRGFEIDNFPLANFVTDDDHMKLLAELDRYKYFDWNVTTEINDGSSGSHQKGTYILYANQTKKKIIKSVTTTDKKIIDLMDCYSKFF